MQAQKQALIDRHLIIDNQAMIDNPTDGNQRLAGLIEQAIQDSPLNAKEIASECGVTPQAVSGWKKTGRISKETLERFAFIVNKPLSYFSTLSAEQERTPYGSPVRAVEGDDANLDIIHIRKVKLRLSAGIVGFAMEPEREDANPIYFRKEWFVGRGYKPEKLIAIRVKGQSMEPGLYDGDTVVINTADTTPKDGEVYAVNYEGEDVIKRMARDAGSWWLSSDNPDQRRFPRKECGGDMCIVIGRVIHKQSERI